MKKASKIGIFGSLVIMQLVLSVNGCENIDKFYRPNLPEKLCSIGIIDIDDTINYDSVYNPWTLRSSARFISFEKSYQSEFPEEVVDSLRTFSFTISSQDKVLFKYECDSVIKNLVGFNIPGNIEFSSNNKYFLSASEANTPLITAECDAPIYPSELVLNSFSKEETTLEQTTPCLGLAKVKTLVVDFSFNSISEAYYAILLEGEGLDASSIMPTDGKIQIEFNVRESNSPGFFSELKGFETQQYFCNNNHKIDRIKVPVYGYFIEGSKIPDNKCSIKISTQFRDERSPFEFIMSLQVRLLSVPKDLFHFEKSLYAYDQNSIDPFSEPVYLNGNIRDGNGVFAICRSRVLPIKFKTILK